MKKFLLILAASAFVVSCDKLGDNQYEISGTVDPSLNGKDVILEKQGEMGYIGIDTVKVEDGKFTFKGQADGPSLHFLQLQDIQGKAELILEGGQIEVAVDKDSIFKTTRKGTYNNDKLTEYYNDINVLRKQMMAFQKKNQAEMMNAYKNNDTVAMNRLNKSYEAIGSQMKVLADNFIEKNPKAFITVLLLKQAFGMDNPPYAEMKKRYDALDPEVKKTKEGKELGELVAKAKVAEESAASVEVGAMAPDFSAATPDGKKLSLKESLGKVTIIDFWASWCKPCRMENPNVVALYNELHSKGLNIIGVSLDKDAAKWKEAIAADKLTWGQISNLKFWDEPIAAQYGVKSIPATFILDATGKIVARDLRGDQLKAKVSELLAK